MKTSGLKLEASSAKLIEMRENELEECPWRISHFLLRHKVDKFSWICLRFVALHGVAVKLARR